MNKPYGDQYLERLQHFFVNSKKKSYSLMDLREGDEVLDIGCGIGNDVINIAQSRAKITGIDNDKGFIAIARENAKQIPNINFICCEADQIPLQANSIDKIRFDRTLQHISNHDAVLTETNRLLKPGGLLIITEPDYLSWHLFLNDENFEYKLMQYIAYGRFKNAHLIRKLSEALRKNGFELQSIEVFNYIITDFEFANYIVDFVKIIKEGFSIGKFTLEEFDSWRRYIHDTERNFNLSLNLLQFAAKKIT
jgi:ubiquinone/menaquinone biosynthesis C-methylase UbiE